MIKVAIFTCLTFGLIYPTTSSLDEVRTSPTTQQIINTLINRLFKLCNQSESISFLECEPLMIQNDKKIGKFRSDYNYTRQSIYIMAVYDVNQDGKLDKNQLFQVASDVMNEKITQQKIQKKIRQLQIQNKILPEQPNNKQIQQQNTISSQESSYAAQKIAQGQQL